MRGARPELTVIEGGGDDQDHGPEAKHSNEGLPLPPEGVPEVMHAEWYAVLSDLKARRLLNDSMLGVVRSYVMAQWTAAQAEKATATFLCEQPPRVVDRDARRLCVGSRRRHEAEPGDRIAAQFARHDLAACRRAWPYADFTGAEIAAQRRPGRSRSLRQ